MVETGIHLDPQMCCCCRVELSEIRDEHRGVLDRHMVVGPTELEGDRDASTVTLKMAAWVEVVCKLLRVRIRETLVDDLRRIGELSHIRARPVRR